MSKFLWILGGTTLALAIYAILQQDSPAATTSTGAQDTAGTLSGWGTKQRVSGTGGQLKGKVEQGAGNLLGDSDLAGQGAADEVAGNVQNLAGKAANAVAGAIRSLDE